MEQEKAMPVTIKSNGTVDSTRVYDSRGREIGSVDKLDIHVDAKKNVVKAVLTMENPRFEFIDGLTTLKEKKGKK